MTLVSIAVIQQREQSQLECIVCVSLAFLKLK